MSYEEALKLVLDLAEENMIDEDDLPEEHARQLEAIETVQRLLKALPYILNI